MKLISSLAILCLTLAACSHGSGAKGSSGTPPAPTGTDGVTSKVSLNQPSECPTAAEGRYRNDSIPSETPTEITKADGTYFMSTSEGHQVPLDGVLTNIEGTQTTGYCAKGQFKLEVLDKGERITGTVSFNAKGFTTVATNVGTGQTATVTFTKL